MIVFHRKGDHAGRTGQSIGEYIPLHFAEDGFHESETYKLVPAPDNALELKAAYFSKLDAERAARDAEETSRRAKEAAWFALSPCDRFVKRAMLDYPGIFPTRIKVLEHAFVCLGNGIRWVPGDTRDLDGPGAGLSYSPRQDRPPVGAYEFPTMSYDDLDITASFRRGYLHVLDDPKTTQDEKDAIEKRIARMVEFTKEETEKERAAREERERNIDLWIKPDPNAVISGHYGSPGGILSYQPDLKKFGGYRCCTTIYDMPRDVHPSFRVASLEVLDASIRGNPNDPNIDNLNKLRASIIAHTKNSVGEIGVFAEKAPRRVPYRAPKHVFEVKFEEGQSLHQAFMAAFGGGEKEAKDIIRWATDPVLADDLWSLIMQNRPHYLIGDRYHERIAGPFLERSKDNKIRNKKYAQAKDELLADLKTFLADMTARGLHVDPKAAPKAKAPPVETEEDGWAEVEDWLTEMEAGLTPEEKIAGEALAAKLKAEKEPPVVREKIVAQPRDSEHHPVYVDAKGRRIQYREVGPPFHTINVLVNGVAVKAFSDYADVVNYAKWVLGIMDEGDLEVLYREYKHDYDKRF